MKVHEKSQVSLNVFNKYGLSIWVYFEVLFHCACISKIDISLSNQTNFLILKCEKFYKYEYKG